MLPEGKYDAWYLEPNATADLLFSFLYSVLNRPPFLISALMSSMVSLFGDTISKQHGLALELHGAKLRVSGDTRYHTDLRLPPNSTVANQYGSEFYSSSSSRNSASSSSSSAPPSPPPSPSSESEPEPSLSPSEPGS